jgi:hypothetical protein
MLSHTNLLLDWNITPVTLKLEKQKSNIVRAQHHLPVSIHVGPAVFGDTSPKFVDANAATNGPFPGKVPLFMCFSVRYEA